MQFDKLQLTLLLGLYYIDKSKNIESFVKRFNVYFRLSISSSTILFELSKYKNVDPANNQVLNTQNLLYKQIWNEYIEADRALELKNIYKRFMRGDFAEQLEVKLADTFLDVDDLQVVVVCNDTPIMKPDRQMNSNSYSYPRSRDVLANALQAADYICEAHCDTKLFLRKNGKTLYTEGHHLIPLEYQEDFSYSLDVEANVVSLCPNCHKLLHYGYDKEMILKHLYEARIDRLKKFNLDIDFASLLLMYR